MKYKLTDTQIKQAKPSDRDYPLADGGGLRLIVRKNGAKVFVFNYYKPYTKTKNNMTLGHYPDISLAQARIRHQAAKSLLAENIDPVQHREEQQRQESDKLSRSFEKIAAQWFEDRKHKADFSERTAKDTWALFERHILPKMGNYPISEITPLIAINAFKPLERDGKLETVRKIIAKINEVMRYALHRGLITSNPLSHIGKEFDKPSSKGMNTIDPEELEGFLFALYQARDRKRFELNAFYAVLLVILTGSRPSEVAGAKVSDIDLNGGLWSYRVQKGNKNLPQGRVHTVTLSSQAMQLVEKIKIYNDVVYKNVNSDYLFISTTAKKGFISIETIRKAISKSIGEDKLTTHGIRHLFSTTLNEMNYNADWIERALSHKDKNRIRRTYNKAEYLEQRKEMLQAWGDYIETLSPKPFL